MPAAPHSPPLPEVPDGKTDFDLCFADLRLRLCGLPTTWDPYVQLEYNRFAERPGIARPDLTIDCQLEPRGPFLPVRPGESTRLEITSLGPAHYRIESHWQTGTIDLAASNGQLLISSRAWIPFRMSVENYLRVVFQLALIERGRFLIHAAGVVDRGRAFLFFGHSGAGKSTVTTFSAPRPALSDDLVLIDAQPYGATAESVPFYGVMPYDQRHPGRWPVAAALRLRQSPDDRFEAATPARAIALIGGSVPFVHELGIAHEGLTRLLAQFATHVPVGELYFTKSAKFWNVLDRQFGPST